MHLTGVHIPGQLGLRDIQIVGEEISSVNDRTKDSFMPQENVLHFKNVIAFPGLVNSHDHLDFDLFPRLGNRRYNSYREWGSDIHQQNKKKIEQVLRVPKHLRIQWGIYKNLLNGFTSVFHHGKKTEAGRDLLSVEQGPLSLHSVAGEKGWRLKMNDPFKRNRPIVVHTGEGTDDTSHSEIEQLIRWNILKKKVIGVHGVAMDTGQAEHFKALVWCPDSNYFLLGKTAPVRDLKKKTRILFGTDSTLTASWNAWEQLRLARSLCMLSDQELFEAVSCEAAKIWSLKRSACIKKSEQADIVVASKKPGGDPWDAFYALNPEDILLVLHKGDIVYFDGSLYPQILALYLPMDSYFKFSVNGVEKFVKGNLPALVHEIRTYDPGIQFPVNVYCEPYIQDVPGDPESGTG
jgi:cytosine/adenosine deaminase-related metal-dependent hydrolase